MRRLFPVLSVCLAVTLLLAAASLWSFGWVSPAAAHRVSLGHGRVFVWVGHAGDFLGIGPGVHTGGWTGDALTWRPSVRRHDRLAVPIARGGAPVGGVTHKVVTGFSVTLPLWMPLLVLSGGTLGCLPAWLSHRRAVRAGCCARCGYDVRGLKDRCPECGRAVPSLLRRAAGAVRRLMALPARPGARPARSLAA